MLRHQLNPVSWADTFLRALIPSFIADAIFSDHRKATRLHPTSYLDGLRGIASVIVFFCHYTEDNYNSLTRSYGVADNDRPETATTGWIQLPFLRIIFSGRPMVHIFFVISGFVLSYKPIKAIHARDYDKCYVTLSSSTFRRAFRLFGPCVASTFMIMCLQQMDLYPGRNPRASWTEQLMVWKRVVFTQITWPWAWDKDMMPGYDIHLWTIPIEFAHSMLLFMVILMLARTKLRIRQMMVLGLMGYCLSCGKWAGFEFLAGLFLAEVHVLKSAREQQNKEWESVAQEEDDDDLDKYGHREVRQGGGLVSLSTLKTVFCISLVILGLFVGGWPNHYADKTPGIRWFLAKTPMPFAKMDHLAPQKFWFGLCAIGTVWAVGELPLLKRFFEGSLAQYCGHISYAIYICHGPVLGLFQAYVFGSPFVPAQGEPGTDDYKVAVEAHGIKGMMGMDNTTQKTMGWFLGLCVLGPIVVWAADIFMRAIDEPIVRIARKMENVCLDREAQPDQRPGGRRLEPGYSQAA
ncbi:acyltransferase 3 [Neurospora intermedia]|uniref:Acyltransferase 3 n=1 Tax=Neurospora intermedia TaxID=5142 RepID=A0ABR3DPM6_NEUIN